jgi:hypothetical protein
MTVAFATGSPERLLVNVPRTVPVVCANAGCDAVRIANNTGIALVMSSTLATDQAGSDQNTTSGLE